MKYSLVIIGAGITGLSAGIAWCKNNDIKKKPVIIIEKNRVPGGCVTSFKRGGYLFDTSQMIPDSTELLEYLGVDIKLKKFTGDFFRLFLADTILQKSEIINIPTGYNEFLAMMQKRFPEDASRLHDFMKTCEKMFSEMFHLKLIPNKIDLIKTLFKCPTLVKYMKKTFKEFYSSFGFKDPMIYEILDGFAAFSGLPAEKVSAFMTVGAFSTILNGSYRPEKGFIHFPLAMQKRFKELGGKILQKTEVTDILTENGKVKGIKLDSGEIIEAENIITTIDPKHAMKNLVGIETLRKANFKYAQKVLDVEMSPSSFTISLGLSSDPGLKSMGFEGGYNMLTTGKGTFEILHKSFLDNSLLLSPERFHLAVICPFLTTGGRPNLIIRVLPVSSEPWIKLREKDYQKYMTKKENISEFYIDLVEKYMVPNLRKLIKVKDIATPATFKRFLGSPSGSNYDMAPVPENFGRSRLSTITPIQGLYQPKFSHGIWPSLQGGLQAVDIILKGKIMNGYSRFRN